jgi:hypothetical protein
MKEERINGTITTGLCQKLQKPYDSLATMVINLVAVKQSRWLYGSSCRIDIGALNNIKTLYY